MSQRGRRVQRSGLRRFTDQVQARTDSRDGIVLGLHGLAFIGGWLEQIGSITNSPRLVMVGILSSVIMPSEAIWRRASYVMQSAIGRTLDFSPFGSQSAPSMAMVGYAVFYLLVALALALYRFQERDL